MQTTQSPKAGERTQHTPGPWPIRHYTFQGTGRIERIEIGCQRKRNAPSVCAILSEFDEECEANARLISAAPELLEIVQILEHWRHGSDSIHFGALVGKEDGDTLGKLVMTAINKFEGRI